MSDETMQAAQVADFVEDDPRKVRLAKREALLAEGKNPYGSAYRYTHHVDDLNRLYADLEDGATTEDQVKVAGRIMAIRDQGKIMFIVLRDSGNDIQLFCRINSLGEDLFKEMKDLDVGDWIGAEGAMMRTRRGQLSVAVEGFTLLSKSIRPLPEKFHGLADKEIRYRQRYVDLVMNPEVRSTFEKRFKIMSAIRNYMDGEGYYEVETPFLHSIMGGANAKPFITHFNALDRDFYLRIATELPLKRLLVGGFERVYEMGRVFRNEGMDPYHNPEFTTIEMYAAYSDLEGMMRLAEGVIQHAAMAACGTCKVSYQGTEIDLSGTWEARSMIDLASEGAGEEVSFDRSIEDLRAIAARVGIKVEEQWGKGKLIAEIFEETCEDKLIQPIFVTDHPVEVSPLAKKKADDPNLTERFELYICGHEFANAFGELNDPVDQAERFRAQVESKDYDDEAMGYDDDYIRALEYGMPPAGGMGIGIDRLCMLLTDSLSIRDVLLFPAMREEAPAQPKQAAPAAAEPVQEAQAPAIDFSKVQIEDLFEDQVDFETFSKSDFRAVKVKACEAVKKSAKLLKFTLDDGTGVDRQILSGIHAFYEPEELVGKTLVAIVNLPPRKMMGQESCGMLLSAVHTEKGEEKLNLIMVDDKIPAGAKLC